MLAEPLLAPQDSSEQEIRTLGLILAPVAVVRGGGGGSRSREREEGRGGSGKVAGTTNKQVVMGRGKRNGKASGKEEGRKTRCPHPSRSMKLVSSLRLSSMNLRAASVSVIETFSCRQVTPGGDKMGGRQECA
eukprot:491916-Hanusia_phi.AAC.1